MADVATFLVFFFIQSWKVPKRVIMMGHIFNVKTQLVRNGVEKPMKYSSLVKITIIGINVHATNFVRYFRNFMKKKKVRQIDRKTVNRFSLLSDTDLTKKILQVFRDCCYDYYDVCDHDPLPSFIYNHGHFKCLKTSPQHASTFDRVTYTYLVPT